MFVNFSSKDEARYFAKFLTNEKVCVPNSNLIKCLLDIYGVVFFFLESSLSLLATGKQNTADKQKLRATLNDLQ